MGIGSASQYEKEKFVVDNADADTLAKWDTGDISTHAAYIKIKQEKEAVEGKLNSKEQEIENIKAGYELKLKAASSDDKLNEIIKERDGLKEKYRTEYEKAQELRGKVAV